MESFTAAGRPALDAAITNQAQIIAYIDDFKLLMILTLARSRWFCSSASHRAAAGSEPAVSAH